MFEANDNYTFILLHMKFEHITHKFSTHYCE